MHPSERLAAHLAGELSVDERRALEAELATDPELRAQLEAMRRADAALGAEPPTPLPDGARERLLAAVAPVLAEELGDADSAGRAAAAGGEDELAARRRRSANRRGWLTAVGGVAAAIVAVAVVVPSLGGMGGEDAEVTADSAAPAAGSAEAGAAADAEMSVEAPLAGPRLVGGDRPIDADTADALLDAVELEDVAARGLDAGSASELGTDWALALGASTGPHDAAAADDGEASADDEVAATEAEQERAQEESGGDVASAFSDASGGSAEIAVEGPVDDAARADVGRCLDVLLETGVVAVPVLAELVTFDGDPSVAFALVAPDADGQLTRREVWVLTRDGCDVRYFSQR